MGENIKKDSSAKRADVAWVLALEAPSRSNIPQQPRKMKPRVNETKNEGMHTLIIYQGQDIEDKILTCLQNSINSSENSSGRARIGTIVSATGSVLATENASAPDTNTYDLISLGGRYIISEDGQLQQDGPLTISCVGPSGGGFEGQVFGRVVAAGVVEVVVDTSAYNPSGDE